MKQENSSIYVVEALPTEERWKVRQWQQHSALLPLGLILHTVSTEAGDVELHMPYGASRDRDVLLWAFAEVKRLHPPPTDLERLNTLPLAEQFRLSLDLALEYIQLAEDGRGHNDRSRYLARCLRQIASTLPNSVGSKAASGERSSDQAVVDSGDQDE
ncbi:MAG: hypothetical protein L6Q98_22000 [Anaerolineae bacterium]|nr:hypothetical protein [Anaerolineae bacterium]NUQ07360.1 hypothetical protein [Anaerolineae bacterium]